ncbi:ABCC2, partial [Cordylochernes scorpioides]
MESIYRSPIYNNFSETVSGLSTIRAFRAQDYFQQRNDERVDINQICIFNIVGINRWLGLRLEFLGDLITFCVAIVAISTRGSMAPGLVGLALTYSMSVTESFNWLVRMSTELETKIVAVERIEEYSVLPSEAPWHIMSRDPPAEWPTEGRVELRDYSTRYREGLDLVLKGVNLGVEPGQKVGIVGRTGAGKSSLTLALFRIVEPAEGRILLDGLDVSELGLHRLRSRLAIIPQDPVLFTGSLRDNLDPSHDHGDPQLWQALRQAHLGKFVSGLTGGLDHAVSEGGLNLSVGQRQLVCLARALLKKSKVLILDEATAAVDLDTDRLIQNTIREEFQNCTILTIAHRLHTIMDYD